MRRKPEPTKHASTPTQSLANTAQLTDLRVPHLEYSKHTNKWWEVIKASAEGVAMGACKQTSSLPHMGRKLVPTKNASTPSRSGENTAQYSDFGVMQFLEYRKHTNKWWELCQASAEGVAMGACKLSNSFAHIGRKLVQTKHTNTPSSSGENTSQYSDFGVMHFLEYRLHTNKWWELGQASVECWTFR